MFVTISWLLPSLFPSPGSSSFDAKTRVPRCPIHFRGHVRRWRCHLATARAGTRNGPTPRRGRSSTRTPGSVLTQVMDNPWRFSTWLLARIFRPKCGILITMQTKVFALQSKANFKLWKYLISNQKLVLSFIRNLPCTQLIMDTLYNQCIKSYLEKKPCLKIELW